MPGKGGWFKSYDDEIEDPKVEGLTDSEYRVWRSTLDLCNRSPARLRERGCLYHSKGFPVSAEYIARRLSKPLEEVEAALARLCQAGGESSLLMLEEGTGGPVYRIRAWRKRQLGSDEDQEDPRKIPERSRKDPKKLPGRSRIVAARRRRRRRRRLRHRQQRPLRGVGEKPADGRFDGRKAPGTTAEARADLDARADHAPSDGDRALLVSAPGVDKHPQATVDFQGGR